LQAVLAGWGFETLLAASEDEALEKLQSCEPPHAIITDYRLRDGKTGAQGVIDPNRKRVSNPLPPRRYLISPFKITLIAEGATNDESSFEIISRCQAA